MAFFGIIIFSLLSNYISAELFCPDYVYAHREDVDTAISCVLTGTFPEMIRWYSLENKVFLNPGQSYDNGRIMFNIVGSINNSSIGVELVFKTLKAPDDYVVYTLATYSSQNNFQYRVKLLERGQGKAPFHWWDYLIFVIILAVSAAIGVYFGFFSKSKHDQTNYMLGGRKMGWFPVSLSLLASFMSAITILGTPGEIYTFGTQYIMIALSYPFVAAFAAHAFLPIFYKLRITSAYEYLQLRFNRPARILGAAIFVFQMIIYMSMVIYMPSVALEAVTGLNFWLSAISTAVVCIFYTSLGGMKAAMWTDAFQVIMMGGGLVAIFIQGCIREGGFSRAWARAEAHGRIEFNQFSPDPRIRHSVWTLTIGSTFTWLYTYGVNQAQVQRGLSARTLKTAQIAFWINVPGLILMMLFPALCGILIYSRYKDCDPVHSGLISKRDQLLVIYVIDIVAEDLPGIPGLFIATLFSGALSTISSGINGLAAVTCHCFGAEEFMRSKGLSERAITWITKLISALYGGLCILLIFPIQHLPGLLDSALALFGALGGPLLGIFMCGIFIPWINAIGAIVGMLVSVAMTLWITFGEKLNPHVAKAQRLPESSTLFCDWNHMPGLDTANHPEPAFYPEQALDFNKLEGLEHLYSLSYLHLSIVGIFTSFLVGIIVSAVTGFSRPSTADDFRLINGVAAKFYAFVMRIKLPDESDKDQNGDNLPENLKKVFAIEEPYLVDKPRRNLVKLWPETEL